MLKEQWIKVTEALPELKYPEDKHIVLSNVVLVWNGYSKKLGYRLFDQFNDCVVWRSDSEGWDIRGVTHWMHLPEDPVE